MLPTSTPPCPKPTGNESRRESHDTTYAVDSSQDSSTADLLQSESREDKVASRLGVRLGRATTVMVGLVLAGSFMNYAASIIFSRLLSPASYGDLTALTAITVIAAVPIAAAQTIVAERIAVIFAAGAEGDARYLIRYAVAHIGAIALFVSAVYVACIPWIRPTFHLQTTGPLIALVPLLLLSFFLPVAYGVLQGMERFTTLGIVMLAIATSRIVIGVPWTLAGGGAGGPIFGQAVGTLLALLACAYLLRPYLLRRGTGAARAGLRRRLDRRTLTAGGVFMGFALISSLDLLLAKLLLSAHAAGEYAALATIEKIVLFLPGAVAIVMVPNAATAKHTDGSNQRVLRIASLLVAATTLLAALPAGLAPHLVVRLMFGARYMKAAPGVLPIVCAGAALALLYLLVTYTVAIRDSRSVWLLAGGLILQVAVIGIWHSSPVQIATAQACVVAVVLFANECVLHPLMRKERLFAGAIRRLAAARGR